MRFNRSLFVIITLGILIAVPSFPQIQAQTRATPEIGMANLPAQRIGPNDLIAVSVYGSPELTRTIRVGAEGLIRFPMLKSQIQAEGLLPGALETALGEALKSEGILVDPVVTVTIVEYHSRPVSVAGAVKNPITFQATHGLTLLEALTRAGGLTPDAGPEILVTRAQTEANGKTISLTQHIPVQALIDFADPEANLRLHGGEEIRVPEAGKVFVVGNVKRPGAFPVQEGSQTTVLRALALAEGLTPFAGKEAYVIRRDEQSGERNQIPIPLRKILEREEDDVSLLANDILYIPDSSGRRATFAAIDRVIGFGTATVSGLLIWRGR